MSKHFAIMIITFVGSAILTGCGATGEAFLQGMVDGSAQHQQQWQYSNYGFDPAPTPSYRMASVYGSSSTSSSSSSSQYLRGHSGAWENPCSHYHVISDAYRSCIERDRQSRSSREVRETRRAVQR